MPMKKLMEEKPGQGIQRNNHQLRHNKESREEHHKEHHKGEQLLPEFHKMISRAAGDTEGKVPITSQPNPGWMHDVPHLCRSLSNPTDMRTRRKGPTPCQ